MDILREYGLFFPDMAVRIDLIRKELQEAEQEYLESAKTISDKERLERAKQFFEWYDFVDFTLTAKSWDSLATLKYNEYTSSSVITDFLYNMRLACDSRGYLVDVNYCSPHQLYDALSSRNGWRLNVRGEIPDYLKEKIEKGEAPNRFINEIDSNEIRVFGVELMYLNLDGTPMHPQNPELERELYYRFEIPKVVRDYMNSCGIKDRSSEYDLLSPEKAQAMLEEFQRLIQKKSSQSNDTL